MVDSVTHIMRMIVLQFNVHSEPRWGLAFFTFPKVKPSVAKQKNSHTDQTELRTL